MTLRALEFYSGIGAFAQAAAAFDIEIVSAFDQSESANVTYKSNYKHAPNHRNLDSISSAEIAEADLWWMSPPCTPFSRRGRQKDQDDNRAKSFFNLIEILKLKRPRYLLIENVAAFAESAVCKHLLAQLQDCGYATTMLPLCASDFGTPMLRPRLFIIASFSPLPSADHQPPPIERLPLLDYIFENGADFDCAPEMVERYEPVLNIVDPKVEGSYTICFTSGYRRCRSAGGSLLKIGDRVRFFSPSEILGLLGFAENYKIPDTVPIEAAYRLVGNSVDVRAIKHLLGEVLHLS